MLRRFGDTLEHALDEAWMVGTEVFEIRDVIDGEYGTGMIEKMLQAAKTIKSTTAASV